MTNRIKKVLIYLLTAAMLAAIAMFFTGCIVADLTKKLEMPLNVQVEIWHRSNATEYHIFWDEVEGAEGYSAEIDGATLETKEPTLDITDYVTPGIYSQVNLRALGNHVTTGDSDVNKAIVRIEIVCEALIFTRTEDASGYAVTSSSLNMELLAGRVVLPDYYNELPVIEIYENAFFNETLGNYNPQTGHNCNTVTTNIRFPKHLTKIGKAAFAYCTALRNITLPETVTEIGNQSFYNCIRLSTINLKNMTSIGDAAFYGCKALSTVELNDDINYLGLFAFDGTPAVDNVTESLVTFGSILYRFNDSEATQCTLPDTIDKVGAYAFGENSVLTKVDLNGALLIGGYAFYQCTALEEVVLSDNQPQIYEGTFAGCSSLTTVNIPSAITSIGNIAFAGTSISEIVCPDTLESIGTEAFSSCSKLTKITLNEGLTSIGDFAFYSCALEGVVAIPSTLETISQGAFLETFISGVIIKEGVKEIGFAAFAECSKLEYIVIPASLSKLNISFLAASNAVQAVYYAATGTEGLAFEQTGTDDPNATAYALPYLRAAKYYYSQTEPELNSSGTDYIGLFWRYVDDLPSPWTLE